MSQPIIIKKYIVVVQVTRQLTIDIVNNFRKEGAEVELITGVIESNYETLDIGVKVTYLVKYNNSSFVKRMLTWSLFTISSFFCILFSNPKKELILITTPPFIVFTGLFFKKIRNQNYHLVIWDLYPDVMVNFGVLKESSFIIKIWKKFNKKCFDSARNIFTLGRHLADAIEKYTSKEIVIIPNWTNTDFVKPTLRADNPFAIRYKLTDKLVVMYSGNLGITHDIESIVNTAEVLKNNLAIHFVIIGDGAKKNKISQMVKEKKLDNVLMLPYQDKEVLPFSLGCADIGIVTLGQGAENISVPSKTYYILSAGSLILAMSSLDSELGLIVENYKCGKVFDKPNAHAVADFIADLAENKEKMLKYKENSRKASFNFTPKNAEIYYNYICGQTDNNV